MRAKAWSLRAQKGKGERRIFFEIGITGQFVIGGSV